MSLALSQEDAADALGQHVRSRARARHVLCSVGSSGGIMRMMMEQMAQIAMQRSMEESGPKVPPASERVRDALPRVVVTKDPREN